VGQLPDSEETAVAGCAAEAPKLPGEAGVWVLIFGDMAVFSAFFLTFAYYRAEDAALFHRSSATLNPALGALNTLLMLTSSWFVATGMHALRRGRQRPAAQCFLSALGCGLGFVGVKAVEYGAKFSAGITPATNDFYMFYFALTGIHLLHVLFGMAVLAFLARGAARGPIDARKIQHFESGASFWHLVDLLWIVLFALLYLAG
jgi:nitric oxide reductase NorE protein